MLAWKMVGSFLNLYSLAIHSGHRLEHNHVAGNNLGGNLPHVFSLPSSDVTSCGMTAGYG